MPRSRVEYTPVRSPRGKLTHAVRYSDVGVAACGRRVSMTIEADEPLTCEPCKKVVGWRP